MPCWEILCKRRALRICRFVWTHFSNRFSSSRLWPWRAGTSWPVIFSAVSSHWKRNFGFRGSVSQVPAQLFCCVTRSSKRCLTECPRWSKRLRVVPGQNALGNHVALVKPGQGVLRWNFCSACQGYGHYTRNCRVRSRSGKEQTPEAKRARWSENRKGGEYMYAFLKEFLRYNGFKWWLIGLEMKSRMNRLIRHLWDKVERWMELQWQSAFLDVIFIHPGSFQEWRKNPRNFGLNIPVLAIGETYRGVKRTKQIRVDNGDRTAVLALHKFEPLFRSTFPVNVLVKADFVFETLFGSSTFPANCVSRRRLRLWWCKHLSEFEAVVGMDITCISLARQDALLLQLGGNFSSYNKGYLWYTT